MTILQLSAVHNWGGGGNHIENLCYELSLSHPHVRNIIMVARNGEFHERLKKSSFEYVTVPLAFNLDPRAIFHIIEICRKRKVDIIHVHGSTSLALAVIADHLADLPPFIFSKKISFPIRKRRITLYKYNYHKIQKYLCVSKQTELVMSKAIKEKEKLVTIYHGTRLDTKSTVTPFSLRERFDIGPETIIVGNVANHHFSKDLGTFIEVADHLINQLNLKNFHFIQIGSFTKISDPWLAKVKQLNLQKHFNFLGHEPNASNFIPQFDIFLLTSTNEGFPQVIYEAFYHKIPVVSTEVAGVPEVVIHGENGLLAEKRDVKKLSEHVITLAEDPALRDKLTAANKTLVMEKFSTAQMAEKTLTEYKKVLDD